MSKVKVLDKCLPKIYLDYNAYQKMKLYIDKNDDEVSWLCTVKDSINKQNQLEITITDTLMFEQTVSSVETEVTDEGMNQLANELLKQADGMEIWNSIKAWGHSHVNMSVSPSVQDETQMELFSDHGHDWFVRIIANKKNDWRVDLYRYDLGIIYESLVPSILLPKEVALLKENIKKLEQKIEEFEGEKIKELTPVVEKEMDGKIKKQIYSSKFGKLNSRVGYDPYGSDYYGSYQSNKGFYDKQEAYSKKKYEEEEKEEVIIGDLFDSNDDVYLYFDDNMLFIIAEEAGDIVDTMDLIYHYMYEETFIDLLTNYDLKRIMEVAYKFYVDSYGLEEYKEGDYNPYLKNQKQEESGKDGLQ